MALPVQRPAEEMGAGARLQADQRGLHVRGVSQQLLLRELLPHKHLAGCAECYNVKGRLAKIDANGMYLHVDDPPSQELPLRSTC